MYTQIIWEDSLNTNIKSFCYKELDIYQTWVIENYLKNLLKAPGINNEISVTNVDSFSNPDWVHHAKDWWISILVEGMIKFIKFKSISFELEFEDCFWIENKYLWVNEFNLMEGIISILNDQTWPGDVREYLEEVKTECNFPNLIFS